MSAVIRRLGRVDYVPVFDAMRSFTEARTPDTPDELWVCEHPPVYTQGLAGKPEHVMDAHGIVVVQTNRGGQVTFHGPGQVVVYPLIDLRRLSIYVKEYVHRLEQAVIKTLENFGVTGHRVAGAPGIYVKLDGYSISDWSGGISCITPPAWPWRADKPRTAARRSARACRA